MPQSVVRRAFVAVAGAAALALGVTVPAHAAGTAGPIKKLGTVNLREAAAAAKHAQYRPALRNLPAAEQFAALEERRNGEEPPCASRPRRCNRRRSLDSGSPPTRCRRGFEGLDIRDTVFSQGFEVEPPDQGLCGGTFGATTFLWEEVNLAIGLFDTQQNQYTPPGARPERALRRAAGVRPRHRPVRAVPQRPEVLLRPGHRPLVPHGAGGRRRSGQRRSDRRRQHAPRRQPDARSAGALHRLRDRRNARRLHAVHR